MFTGWHLLHLIWIPVLVLLIPSFNLLFLCQGNASGTEDEEEEPLAPVQQLPDEVLTLIFEKLPIYALGYVACVCKQFKDLVEVRRGKGLLTASLKQQLVR